MDFILYDMITRGTFVLCDKTEVYEFFVNFI